MSGDHWMARDSRSEINGPTKVTMTQWALAGLCLLLAGVGYLVLSYGELAFVAALLAAVNVLLVVSVTKEVFKTKVLGKFLLVLSTLVFFWLEALEMARERPPFAVPEGVPIPMSQFGPDLVGLAFLYVACFEVMLLAGYSVRFRMPRLLSWIRSRVDSPSRLTWALRYGLAACALAPLLLSYGFDIGAAVGALMAARSGVGPDAEDIGLFHNLYYLGMYGAALLLAEGLVLRRRSRAWGVLAGGIAAAPFVMWGARHLWLFVALPACVLAISRFRGRVGAFRALRWAVMGLLVLVVVQLQFALRGVGWREIGNLTSVQLIQGGQTGQFVALLFAEYLVPDMHDYFLEAVEPYFLTHWIPRQFWPDKPVMRSWAYYNDAYTLGSPYNVTPSVVGQFHINWGVGGVLFIGFWLGFLTFLADRAVLALDVDRQRAMTVALGMFYAFIVSSFRFYSPIYFTYFVFGLIGALLVTQARSAPKTALGMPVT